MEKTATDKYNAAITAALAEADKLPPPPIETIFDDVYAELPWHLAEQREWLLAQTRTKSPHQH